MGARRDLLLRFVLLYATLYCSFGFSSPFLPAFLTARGIGPEWLGILLGAGTAVRLLSAPLAGRLADVFGAFRLELALFAISAAVASLLYNSRIRKRKVIERDWLVLVRQPAFVRMVLAAALVLGSHAMNDAFAIIRWSDAGISPAVSSVLWSESVGAEEMGFVLLGPWLLDVLGASGGLALGAGAALVRWGVMAQTANVAALAAIEPLHGLTFALFHLGCMRIIAETVPRSLAGTAQAFYGTVGIGGTTALLIIVSGWLFARLGPAGFWVMAFLSCAALPIIWSLQLSLTDMRRAQLPTR